MANQSDPRFRSFAERYIIARASFFRVNHETEDAWKCLLDAKRVYKMAERMGETVNLDPSVPQF